MILICLLYMCGVWIESVDPVADLCLYRTILSTTAEELLNSNKEITVMKETRLEITLQI